jgi:hypothetical protein
MFEGEVMMKSLVTISLITICLVSSLPAQDVAVTVPGTSNLWLAGMPDGTTMFFEAGFPSDAAPAQSPVLVSGVQFTAGSWITVSRATGQVTRDQSWAYDGPDGASTSSFHWLAEKKLGDNYGKSTVLVPYDALVGVFLTDAVPTGAVPAQLDFSTVPAMNYSALSPLLNQAFFIGDGLTSAGSQQKIFAPNGATRLYLGVMDSSNWSNNLGHFDLTVSVVPEPATMVLVGLGGAAIRRVRKVRRV